MPDLIPHVKKGRGRPASTFQNTVTLCKAWHYNSEMLRKSFYHLFSAFLLSVLVFQSGCMYFFVPKAGKLYLSGEYAKLEAYLEEKLAKGKDVKPAEYSLLCGAYAKLKKYDELFACGDRMEENIEKGDDSMFLMWDTAYAYLWSRAFGYIEIGDYETAVAKAKFAYRIVREKRLDVFNEAYALSALALAQALSGRREEALRTAALLEQVRPWGFKYGSMRTEKFIELTKIYLALAEYEKALETIRRAEKEEGASRDIGNVVTGAALAGKSWYTYQKLPRLFMLNKALYETGRMQEAKQGYDALLAEPDLELDGDIFWVALFDRGRIAQSEGHLAEAAGFYEKSVGIIEKQRSTLKTEATRIGFIGSKQAVYHHLIACLFAKAKYRNAFEYAERAKSRALVDLLASRKEFTVKRGDEKEIREILKKLEELETQQWTPSENPQDASKKRSLSQEFRTQLKARDPELASLVTVTVPSAEELQSHLRENEVLLEYYYSGDDLYSFVLTQKEIRASRLDARNLAAEVQAFREALQDPQSDRYLVKSQALFQKLIRPMEDLLIAKNVIVVPHGLLHYVPFQALHSGSEFLIDRYSLRYLPSASVMPLLERERKNAREKLLAMGNPDLEGREAGLAYAEQEVRALGQSFPDAKIVIRRDATESLFRKIAGEFPYLHLATHGIFQSGTPLASGLMFTRDSENDGFLSVAELYSLRLDAELVTLSACETGLSKISSGDELVGLTRGFLYAGTQAVVSSLWSVDDEATSYLMREFYAKLKEASKQEALRAAQLAAKQKYPHPFYWAAFELTGRS
jgi:CHAT domain-containing protein